MNAAHLFHVSEDPDIKVFHPRPPPSPDAGVTGDVVWAIDYKHLPNYLAPRDCPRVTFGRNDRTSLEDAARFLDGVEGRVVVVELEWLERMRRTPIYVYAFERNSIWRCADATAGYFVCNEPVAPLECIRIGNPASALMALGAELRARANLWNLIDQVSASTLDFSIIRKRNARPRPTI